MKEWLPPPKINSQNLKMMVWTIIFLFNQVKISGSMLCNPSFFVLISSLKHGFLEVWVSKVLHFQTSTSKNRGDFFYGDGRWPARSWWMTIRSNSGDVLVALVRRMGRMGPWLHPGWKYLYIYIDIVIYIYSYLYTVDVWVIVKACVCVFLFSLSGSVLFL